MCMVVVWCCKLNMVDGHWFIELMSLACRLARGLMMILVSVMLCGVVS